MTKMNKSLIALMAASFLIVGISSCKKYGTPAEDAGRKIDQMVEKADQKIDAAIDKTGQKIKDTGQKMQDSAKDSTN